MQLIHDPGTHLHQPMAVPEKLSQIPILRIRYTNLRKVIFRAGIVILSVENEVVFTEEPDGRRDDPKTVNARIPILRAQADANGQYG